MACDDVLFLPQHLKHLHILSRCLKKEVAGLEQQPSHHQQDQQLQDQQPQLQDLQEQYQDQEVAFGQVCDLLKLPLPSLR